MTLNSAALRLSRSRPFAIAYLTLKGDDGLAIDDGIHELYTYQVTISIMLYKHTFIELVGCINRDDRDTPIILYVLQKAKKTQSMQVHFEDF